MNDTNPNLPVVQSSAEVVPLENHNLSLSAETPLELSQCHATMMDWARTKIALCVSEARELKEAYEHALARKWKTSVLKKHWQFGERRVEFFQKVLAALESGYYIIPNMPGATVFALRTNDKTPDRNWKYAMTYEPKLTQVIDSPLPSGQGEYQNPEPTVEDKFNDATKEGKVLMDYRPLDWQMLDFPAHMSRLKVMTAATRAMALKIFDEIQMLPTDRQRHADPILIGTIVCKGKYKYRSDWPTLSFMIAWHLDTRTI